jgi:hypothetical protein
LLHRSRHHQTILQSRRSYRRAIATIISHHSRQRQVCCIATDQIDGTCPGRGNERGGRIGYR